MQAYRWSVQLKLGLIVFALVIAVASLWYTSQLVERLRVREQATIQLWADAQAQVAQMQTPSQNPHRRDFEALRQLIERLPERRSAPVSAPPALLGASGAGLPITLDSTQRAAFAQALDWAQRMPSSGGEVDFISNKILFAEPFTSIPAIVTDSATGRAVFWRNVDVPDTLAALDSKDSARAAQRLSEARAEMDETYRPVSIRLSPESAGGGLTQRVHYDESGLIKELRTFPYVQLLFVGLFIAVGYVGFSYVRRSEQSSLWVGMAKEAAHQLGTPISSLMGWTQLLRADSLSQERKGEALDEIESDIERLQRVAGRFSDIGSMPKLEAQPLARPVERTAEYIRRRLPRAAQLDVDVDPQVEALLNEDLFEWVVENLLKNALDADAAAVTVRGFREGEQAVLEVEDDGGGIERSQWKNVFRPGYSTKKRGWGLGLSLARRVVEDYHGGTLAISRSRPGEGTTFRLELPTRGES
jgi:two-component sensor histidine kinase